MKTTISEPTNSSLSSRVDTFAVLPRNSDTAVVYWNVANYRSAATGEGRLCLQVSAGESGANVSIYLNRAAGHLIVPLLAEDRDYSMALGWATPLGFCSLCEQQIHLPEHSHASVGAMSSALSFRGAHFWSQKAGSLN